MFVCHEKGTAWFFSFLSSKKKEKNVCLEKLRCAQQNSCPCFLWLYRREEARNQNSFVNKKNAKDVLIFPPFAILSFGRYRNKNEKNALTVRNGKNPVCNKEDFCTTSITGDDLLAPTRMQRPTGRKMWCGEVKKHKCSWPK